MTISHKWITGVNLLPFDMQFKETKPAQIDLLRHERNIYWPNLLIQQQMNGHTPDPNAQMSQVM